MKKTIITTKQATVKCIYCHRLYDLKTQAVEAEQNNSNDVRCPYCNGKVGTV